MTFDRHVNYKLAIIFLVILSTLMLTLPGCLSPYRTFSYTQGVAHFKFEYPRDLEKVDVSRTDKYSGVYFTREIVKDGWFDMDLYILVDKAPELDARSRLEKDITRLEEALKVSKVLERSPVVISGISGELVVSTYDLYSHRIPWPDPVFKGAPQGPELIEISREVYFDNNGFAWYIRMTSTEEVAEEAKADFEHVINTFKILD